MSFTPTTVFEIVVAVRLAARQHAIAVFLTGIPAAQLPPPQQLCPLDARGQVSGFASE